MDFLGVSRYNGRMNTKDALALVAEAGQIILENGGETSRVEETMNALAATLGMSSSESFAMPTGIVVTLHGPDGEMETTVRRITKRSINMEKVTQVNNFSRNLESREFDGARLYRELLEIRNIAHFPLWLNFLMSGLCSGSCCVLFGGQYRDTAAAFGIGLIMRGILVLAKNNRFNQMFTNVVGGFVAALAALALNFIDPGFNPGLVIAGSIMLLVPGVLMVNAVRDTIAGDLVAGISRGVEAIVIALSIAVGSGLGYHLFSLLLRWGIF